MKSNHLHIAAALPAQLQSSTTDEPESIYKSGVAYGLKISLDIAKMELQKRLNHPSSFNIMCGIDAASNICEGIQNQMKEYK